MRTCYLGFVPRLDLDVWINEPPSGSESEDEGRKSKGKAVFAKDESRHTKPRYTEVDEKELAKVRWQCIRQSLL